MESREKEVRPVTARHRSDPARILIVGGDPEFRATLAGRLRGRRYRCSHVNRLDEAQSAVAQHRHDLILVNPKLPDGDGISLTGTLRSTTTKTIVFSENASFGVALRALRSGAIDFIRTPASFDEFVERVDAGLAQSRTEQKREERIRRLHRICRELNVAREEITDQVNVLCQDLVTAYRDMNEQINEAAMASEFRTLLRMELDIEEALRTTLEYLLTRTGPTNAAVFLPDVDQHYNLGAYVNYDCPRESIDRLLDHLCEAICPQMSDETALVSFDDAAEFADWIGMDSGLLADSQVLAFSCLHEGECLAVVVLFRSRANPFDDNIGTTLEILRTIFAEQLSQIIKIHHRATPDWPSEATDDEDDQDDFGYGFGGLAA